MKRAAVCVLGFLVLFVAGCGSSVGNYIDDTYEDRGRRGDIATYHSPDPVGTTVSDIVAAQPPAARSADGGREYLRYNDDIVIVSAAPEGGSTVTVEDIDGRFSGGAFIFLGPGFRPGSPASGNVSGGSGGAK
ncbi:DUF4247 domain-containing protein [Rhodococcus sp. CC-R104]|uniref:DUF4247 domain-containing protein n=1 Tax=Rhodococcus chondri TaxID=3065941 RepID=A0ABU7JPY8_9NOCA|nr:DUF4247 domain-containing protein [Rhodococcus sp. CC-R104]MEE2032093.1 DUF4247 domain-containing protein [Rhodococcus sp. CC-R104]